ncbi:unnamed protein product [Chilo suppressalis]|uniref:Uncharacterized protein n=1 Tax=Chilo suppressalis TaxID=168631 RepID=A0ABN8BE58_CHISP|nr:hypothetical protein evm_010585 [Chilo suppressalis]CAH0405957.1 unnamed protein product [Chilo suppressalis]
MSTSRGNSSRKRPQKYQNKTAFKNDLHDSSHKTKLLNSLEISGVCNRCKDIIGWKIKYKKYKALTAPRKCKGCEEKAIKHAYHLLCNKCASNKSVCAKCTKSLHDIPLEEEKIDPDVQVILKGIPERKRRTILRFINKHQNGQQKLTPELKLQCEKLLNDFDKVSLEDEFGFSSEDDCDSSDNEEH